MIGILSGYKTYITGTIGIISAIGGLLGGYLAPAEAVELILTSVLGMTLRSGINAVAK